MMLRISFDLDDGMLSGKHKFIGRLKKQFQKLGVLTVDRDAKPDVHIFINKMNKNAKHNIYRLDGIWINTDQDLTRNDKISEKIKASSGVIFQNDFCQKCVHKILKVKGKREITILNGGDPEEIPQTDFEHPRPFFVALCKWRPHKRLKETVLGFLAAELPNTDLLVFGEPDYIYEHPNVKYLGWQDNNTILGALSKCIASVHLAWLDWCPNSVVESVVMGKQVIHTDSGGTAMIVRGRGYQVHDKVWDYKAHRLYKPPKLDIESVANAYRMSMYNPVVNFEIQDITINTIANKYLSFIEKTVSSGA